MLCELEKEIMSGQIPLHVTLWDNPNFFGVMSTKHYLNSVEWPTRKNGAKPKIKIRARMPTWSLIWYYNHLQTEIQASRWKGEEFLKSQDQNILIREDLAGKKITITLLITQKNWKTMYMSNNRIWWYYSCQLMYSNPYITI